MRSIALLVLLAGCAAERQTPLKTTTGAIEGAPMAEELAWASFAPETFAKAKAEHRFVVLDGSAEWCHWCHVMEATTYHDPSVRRALAAKFIAVKVDIDARPDLAERYGDYGWPATVIFSPDGAELGKYRGYIPPDRFAEILRDVVAGADPGEAGADPGKAAHVIGMPRPAPKTPLPEEEVAWITRSTELELEDYWDPDQGSWGRTQKAPLGWDNAWALSRAEKDPALKKKVLFTLDQQAKLIDPVWGGIYQYSAAMDWDHPHFEKLMTFQAPALENYATAYMLTKDPKQLARANAMKGFLDRFMKSPEGGFYTTQDADVNAHDASHPFMNGHDYYALGDKERLAHGLPRIDTNEYARENGLAIAAYVTLYEATKDPEALATATKAAKHILATHPGPKGSVSHAKEESATSAKRLYLSDNAAFGFGLVRLYEATKDAQWLKAARAIADFVVSDLQDEAGGGLFATTKDPDAVGVFAARRIPFEDNVIALRLFAHLGADYRAPIGRVLRAISVPDEIKGRGRMLGDYLLALDETKPLR